MERKTMTREIGAVHTRTAAAEQKKGVLPVKGTPMKANSSYLSKSWKENIALVYR